jgi:hypothetical protein
VAKPKIPYGTLNPISTPKFAKGFDTNQDSNLDRVKQLLRSFYDNKLEVSGDYTGYVLAVLPDDNSNSFVDRIWESIGSVLDTKPKFKQVKVRVPEIHSWIPEPEDNLDFYQIGLHDTFIALDSLSNLSYGTLVKVTFYDASGKYEPTIKEVLTEGNNPMPSSGPSAKSASENVSMPKAIGPVGNPIGSGVKTGPPNPQLDLSNPDKPMPPVPLKPIAGRTEVIITPAVPYRENRVRVNEDGLFFLPNNSPLLTKVRTRPGWPQQKVHILVANRFEELIKAAANDGIDIYCQSGWRKPWTSRQEYDTFILKNYVNNPKSRSYYENFLKNNVTVERAKELAAKDGARWKAYKSAHFTGLGIDFFIPPSKTGEIAIASSMPGNKEYGKTTDEQKKASGFKWLKENAHKFGFTPLNSEAWHWEVLIPIESWRSGSEFTNTYSVRVVEKSVKNRTTTSDDNFTV